MAQKRIWLYGDSFTEGEGTRILHPEYPEYYHAYKHYHFGNFLRDEWFPDYAIINKGESGGSDQWILNMALSDSRIWKEDDIVIIGNSICPRLTIPVEKNSYNKLEMRDVKYKFVHYGGYILEDEVYNEIIEGVSFSPSIVYGVQQFFATTIANNQKAWEYQNNFISQNMLNLSEIARLKGVRTVVWDQFMWAMFETLNEWSESNIKDLHWSPNGNIQFAHLIYDCLKDGIFDLTISAEGDMFYNWKKTGLYEKCLGDEYSLTIIEQNKMRIQPTLWLESSYSEEGAHYVKYDNSIPFIGTHPFFVDPEGDEDESKSLI